MYTTKQITKTLLAGSLAAIFAIGAGVSVAGESAAKSRTYVDPVTGQTKEAKKLLSEMTDEERALLSNEEYKALKDLEAKLKKHKEMQKEVPASE